MKKVKMVCWKCDHLNVWKSNHRPYCRLAEDIPDPAGTCVYDTGANSFRKANIIKLFFRNIIWKILNKK